MAANQTRDDRPLHALLSQVLVAYTLEYDDEFERQMAESGDPGANLSLIVWANRMRFLAAGELSVWALAEKSLAHEKLAKFQLGCLERWRFVKLKPDAGDGRPVPMRLHARAGRELRDGWGSGRGIRSGWTVGLTRRGQAACQIWPPLFEEIESRWRGRFGEERIASLRGALEAIQRQFEVELPLGLPGGWDEPDSYPARTGPPPEGLPLAALLAQVLLAFSLEFDRRSRTPLVFSANTLRVLGERAIPEADIPMLTGASPETSGIGWQIEPFVIVEPNPAGKRGKAVRLSPLGLRTQQSYRKLVSEIEENWAEKYGRQQVGRLREALRELFVPRRGESLLLAEGLRPSAGTVRSGEQAPALGRRDVGPAAKQRMRDKVAQTKLFLEDPAGALPHYPMWDMNRGFGP